MMEKFCKQELARFQINLLASLLTARALLLYFLSGRDGSACEKNQQLDRGHEQKRCRMIEWLLLRTIEA